MSNTLFFNLNSIVEIIRLLAPQRAGVKLHPVGALLEPGLRVHADDVEPGLVRHGEAREGPEPGLQGRQGGLVGALEAAQELGGVAAWDKGR